MSSSRRTFLASVLAVGVAGCTELSTESEEGPTPTEDPEFGTEAPADSTPSDAPEYAVWSREPQADKLGPVSLGGGPETPAPFVASAEVGDEASDDHTLQALELQDGPERWRLGVADPAQTPPEYLAVDDRSLFVFATGRESLHGEAFVVHAVDPEARERLWRFDTDDRRFLFPMAVDDGTVFVGRRDDQFAEDGEFVYALDGADGEELWRREFDFVVSRITSPRAAGDETVFVGDSSGRLLALSPLEGNTRWELSVDRDGSFRPSVARTSERLYVAGATGAPSTVVAHSDRHVWALDPDAGDPRWTFEPGTRLAGVATAGDFAFVGVDGAVHALDGSGSS
ncbi:hypothetical protein BRC63_05250 [Halobacteriales archaeon QH_10_70_21]|nr:MAG: hypothetical protein BRC63_05250 [Halobacteriales archaeon QH_10_70_21]